MKEKFGKFIGDPPKDGRELYSIGQHTKTLVQMTTSNFAHVFDFVLDFFNPSSLEDSSFAKTWVFPFCTFFFPLVGCFVLLMIGRFSSL